MVGVVRTPDRFPSHHTGGGDDGHLSHADRGLAALLRVDLHAMIRILDSQPLTVADILAASEQPVSHGS